MARRVSVEIVGDASALRRAFNSAAKDSDLFAARMGRSQSALETWGKRGLVTAGVGLGALGAIIGKTGFGFDDLRERSQIAFTTMLGSGQKAKRFLDDLQTFATRTPFNFAGLTQSAQQLLAMGFNAKQIIPTLTAAGDAVAALGGSPEKLDRVVLALGQIQAKGKLTAEEMMQLTEAGIPAWQMLADKIGKTVPQAMALVTKGAIDSGTAVSALVTGMETKFGGMMEKQAHTLSGLFSNFQDTFQQLSGTVMQPFFKMAESGLEAVNKKLADPAVKQRLQELSQEVAVRLKGAFEALAAFMQRNWSAITAALNVTIAVVKTLFATLRDLLVWLGPKINAVVEAIGGWKSAIVGVIATWVAFKSALAITSLVASFNPMVLAITGIALAAGYVITHWQKVKTFFGTTAEFIAKLWGGLKDILIGIAKVVGGEMLTFLTLPIRGLLEAASRLPFGMGKPFKRALDGLKDYTTTWVSDGMKQMARGGAAMGDAWGQSFGRAVKTSMAAALGSTVTSASAGAGARGGAVYAAGKNVNLSMEDPALMQALYTLSSGTGTRLQVTSGYRSTALQAQLYAEMLAGKRAGPVAKPGTSLHEKGLAADVMAIVGGKAVPLTQAFTQEQLAKYGLAGIGANDAVHVQLLKAVAKKNVADTAALTQDWTKLFTSTPTPTADPSTAKTTAKKVADALTTYIGGLNRTVGKWASLFADDKQAGASLAKLRKDLVGEQLAIAFSISSVRGRLVNASAADRPKLQAELDKLVTEQGHVNAQLRANAKQQAAAAAKAAQELAASQVQALELLGQYEVPGRLLNLEPLLKAAYLKAGQQGQWFERSVQRAQAAYQAAVQRFEASYERMLSAATAGLGALYFQGGQTPAERRLAAMQREDQLASLQKALDAAKRQYELDLKSADVTADQLEQDKEAIYQAQRAIEEDRVAQEAAAERAAADKAYADAVERLTQTFEDYRPKIEAGTVSMDEFRRILQAQGVPWTEALAEAFADTTVTVDGPGGVIDSLTRLQNAFDALADYLNKTYHLGLPEKTTTTTTTTSQPAWGGEQAAQAVAAMATSQALQELHDMAVTGQIDPATYRYLAKGIGIPMQHGGAGLVTKPTLFLAGDAGAEDFFFRPRAGGTAPGGALAGGGVTFAPVFHFDRYLGSRDELMREMSSEFSRYLRRNGVQVGGTG